MPRAAQPTTARWLIAVCAVGATVAGSLALRPPSAEAAAGQGGGPGTTFLTPEAVPGHQCMTSPMHYVSAPTYTGTYTDPVTGRYQGPLIVEQRTEGAVFQFATGSLDPQCNPQSVGHRYRVTATVRSPNGEVSCTYGRYGPGSWVWREGINSYAELHGYCSVNGGQPRETSEFHEGESIPDATPPRLTNNYTIFEATDLGPPPPGVTPPPALPTPTSTTITTPPPAAAPQDAPPPPAPREAGPSGPGPVSQEPVRGGLAPAQPPPVQQAPPSQFAQQVQAQQQTQVQAQPAMMLEHQRQLQVERATIERRRGRPQTGYLASARRSREVAPAAAVAVTWGAGLGAFGLALGLRRRLERRWVGVPAPARCSPTARRPPRRRQPRW